MLLVRVCKNDIQHVFNTDCKKPLDLIHYDKNVLKFLYGVNNTQHHFITVLAEITSLDILHYGEQKKKSER